MTIQTRLSGTDYPLNVAAPEFLALADAGLFDQFARAELIEGEVIVLNAVWQWHARTMSMVNFEVSLALRAMGSKLEIFSAGSVLLADDSVPEPDLSIVQRGGALQGAIPFASLKLAIEISDTTRDMDLGRKVKLYAAHGLGEYWVVDRDDQCIIRHASPTADGYSDVLSVAFGERLVAATIDGLIVETTSLLNE